MIENDLGKLFRIARQYGRVRLMTMSSGGYHCCIEFDSVEHTTLEAKSDFKQKTPEDAVRMAISSAEGIVKSVEGISKRTEAAGLQLLGGNK